MTESVVRAPDLELVLRRAGGIEDCAVLVRSSSAGAVAVAYVVPDVNVPFVANRVADTLNAACGTNRSSAVVEVRRMPLAPDGRIDEAALRALPVIDDDLCRRWEAEWRGDASVRDVAVLSEDMSSQPPAVHLSELLAHWSLPADDDRAGQGTIAGTSSPAEDALPIAWTDGGALDIPADAPRTLTEGLVRSASRTRDRGIRFVGADGSERVLSYAQLLDHARRVLTGLRRLGLRAGDRAILQLPDLNQHLPTFWACLLGGITPVTVAVPPAYDGRNAVARKLANTWRLLDGPPVLASARLVERIAELEQALEMTGVRIIPVDGLVDEAPALDHHDVQPGDVAFCQLSSGSTGVSKCIQVTHAGVVAHIHAAQQQLGLAESDVTLNWLPMDHVVPLLMYHVNDVYLGIEQVQMPGTAVLGAPLAWLDAIERHRVTHSWSPNFGYKMLADALAAAPGRRWDLSSVKAFLNAGEQVTLPVVRDFLARVAPFGVPASAMQPAYGMAEVCTAMTYEHRFDLEASAYRLAKSSLHGVLRRAADGEPAVTFINCGPVVRGVQVRIADRTNAVVRERTVGRIQIKGAVVTPGYLNNPEANAEAFVGDDWFNTGDLGFLWDGRLTITGREKELIIVNGANFYCYEIEDIAADVRGVLPTFCAACGVDDPSTGTEALALFFVHDPDSGVERLEVVRRLRTEVAARAGLSPAYVLPLQRDEFPKTTSGKIQRNQLKQWLAAGRFRAALQQLDVELENANTLPGWFYRPSWVRRDDAAAPPRSGGVALVLIDAGGLGEAVRAAWAADSGIAVGVTHGTAFRRLGAHEFEIDSAQPDDYRRLIHEVAATLGPVDHALHLWTYEALPGDPLAPAAVTRELGSGVYSVLLLAKALSEQQPGCELTVVSNHAAAVTGSDQVVPARAAVTGFLRTLTLESPARCRHVDLDASPAPAAAAAVLRELGSLAADRFVAVRDGQRWVSRIEPVDLRSASLAGPALVQGGSYLVTGGLGGVGLEVARYLMREHHARLLIIGRSPAESSVRGAAMRELSALPGEVHYESVDVADAEAVERIVDEAEQRWSRPLDGIFHLAGVFADRSIVDETPETFAVTLRPKVDGGVALHRVLVRRPMTQFVAFSSAYGQLGGFGAGAYAAANAFLDGLVHWQRAHGMPHGRSLAWGLWDETGMSQGYGDAAAARARGFRLIGRRQGLYSLLAALHRDVPHLLIGLDESGRAIRSRVLSGTIAARHAVAYCVDAGTSIPKAGVADRFGTLSRCAVRHVAAIERSAAGEVDRRSLMGREPVTQVGPRNDLEQLVAGVWQAALQRDRLGIHDNFFELGGTSLLAAQIAGRLRDVLDADVVSTQVFQFPTIAAQAAFLSGDAGAHAPAFADRQSRGAARREAARRPRRTPPPAAAH